MLRMRPLIEDHVPLLAEILVDTVLGSVTDHHQRHETAHHYTGISQWLQTNQWHLVVLVYGCGPFDYEQGSHELLMLHLA